MPLRVCVGAQRVSILARASARALPPCSNLHSYHQRVSILARASARALRTSANCCTALSMFQSSPAPRRGRYFINENIPVAILKFQSSPAPRRGRYHLYAHLAGRLDCFNPRPRLGAGATSAQVWRLGALRCFNPRPRLGAGATANTPASTMLCDVSILARASARALQGLCAAIAMMSEFQSSPAPRRGRYEPANTGLSGT